MNWTLVAITGGAITVTVGAFLLAIRFAGRPSIG